MLTIVMTDVCLLAAQHSKVSVSFNSRPRAFAIAVYCREILKCRLWMLEPLWIKEKKGTVHTRAHITHIHIHFCNPKINLKHSCKERRCYFIVSRETRFNRTEFVKFMREISRVSQEKEIRKEKSFYRSSWETCVSRTQPLCICKEIVVTIFL